MKVSRLLQQGDVLIMAVKKMPKGKEVRPENGCFILARGEMTGHAHRLADAAGVEFTEKNGVFYLKNTVPANVTHEEHKTVTIPPGTWEIGIVREYDHFKEEARKVQD